METGGYKILRRLAAVTLLFAAVFAMNVILYAYFQKHTLSRSDVAESLTLSLDKAIPLVPSFIAVYFSFDLIIELPFYINLIPNQFHLAKLYLWLKQRKSSQQGEGEPQIGAFMLGCLRFLSKISDFIFGFENDDAVVWKTKVQTALAYLFLITTSNSIYYFYPLKVLRPDIFNDHTLVGMGVEFLRGLYRYDDPNNSFPSQHAAFSTLAFFIFNYLRTEPLLCRIEFSFWKKEIRISVMGAIIGAWAFLIILSTYFVKQHIIADSLAGVILAYIAFRFGFSEWVYRILTRIGRFFIKKKNEPT